MTIEEMLQAQENSRRMFPPKPKQSSMELLELTADDERILDDVWAELARKRQVEVISQEVVKEAA